MFKNKTALIFFLVSIFMLSIISYFILQNDYFKSSETNYTNSIIREIKSEIKTQKNDTLALAKNLADDAKLIGIMNSGKFQNLYLNDFLKDSKEYFHYENTNIRIIDKDGVSRYLSHPTKNFEKTLLWQKKPHPYVSIGIGKFGIGFRAIMPIYGKKHLFLGVVDVISSFDSIFKELQNNKVHSVIMLNKKLPQTNHIQNFIISNNNLDKGITKLLKKYKIDYFTSIKNYKFVPKTDEIVDGYYVLNIPLYNSKKQNIGNYIAFVYDKFELAQKGIALLAMIILMTIVFIITTSLVFKKHMRGLRHISDLDKEVQNQINEKLKLLHIDSITGAYRKIKFKEDLNKYKDAKAVMLNIRNFSKINEAYGFDIGDMILKISVQRIENLLDKKIYRINSDEFSFFSYNHKKEIRAIKHKFISDSIKILKGAVNLRISFSFGVVQTQEKKLFSKMSIAVKEAKKYPFSDFIFYKNRGIKDNFIKYNSLLYEALARIKYKDKIYCPFLFLDIAKNSGFLHEITKIMIEKSCRYLCSLDKSIEISINITEDDLYTHNLKTFLLKTVKKYNISPSKITLEILEGITTVGTKNNIKQLKRLKEAGFKIAIDDFGVEYSNFERISELDIDFIKIDKKYIKTIHTNPKSFKIAKTINDFAHSLGIEVVAEFVENEEIQNSIKKLGIEYSQGYLFSQPREFID